MQRFRCCADSAIQPHLGQTSFHLHASFKAEPIPETEVSLVKASKIQAAEEWMYHRGEHTVPVYEGFLVLPFPAIILGRLQDISSGLSFPYHGSPLSHSTFTDRTAISRHRGVSARRDSRFGISYLSPSPHFSQCSELTHDTVRRTPPLVRLSPPLALVRRNCGFAIF